MRVIRLLLLTSATTVAALLVASIAMADGASREVAAAKTEQLIDELGLETASQASREHPRWRFPKRIVVRVDTPERIAWLREVAPDAELVGVRSPTEAVAAVPGADVVIGYCASDLVAAGEALRWIQVLWAGVEGCVAIPGLKARNIVLTNMQRVAGPVMAEHVFALLLGLTRGIDGYLAAQRSGEWRDEAVSRDRMRSLDGRTLLVAGLGGIGTEVARLGAAFGMNVIATRASGRHGPDFVSHVGLPDELRDLAARADVVVNTVPLTPATEDMFDGAFFAAVKEGAYFINVGRGGTVDTQALLEALESGRLSGAGLDVTDPEPLPRNHPLFTAPNTIITPHVAASIDTGPEDRWLVVRENLRRYVAGEPLLSVVELERGY